MFKEINISKIEKLKNIKEKNIELLPILRNQDIYNSKPKYMFYYFHLPIMLIPKDIYMKDLDMGFRTEEAYIDLQVITCFIDHFMNAEEQGFFPKTFSFSPYD